MSTRTATGSSFPTPTEAVGWRRIFWWSLPGRTITGLSAFTWLGLFGGLLASEERRVLFFLPGPAWLYGLLAGGLALAVGVVARHRPGRIGPRLWPPLLILLAFGAASAVLHPEGRFEPVAHAAVAAASGAAVILAFRLARPVLTGRRIERVLGAAFTATLLILGVAAPIASQAARGHWQNKVTRAATQLGKIASATVRAGRFGDSEADHAAAHQALDELAGSRLEPLYDAQLWRAAAVFDRGDELRHAWRTTIEAVARGLDAEHAPSLDSYGSSAVWWSPTDKTWLADKTFAARTEHCGRQAQELGRLFAALEPRRVASGQLATELQASYEVLAALENRRRAALTTSWIDGWMLSRLPGAGDAHDRRSVSAALVDRTLVSARGQQFRAAELWNLMVLRAREVTSLGRTPGCRQFDYAENGYSYRRFDCYAYRPAADSPGAEPWFELRLVYRVPSSSFQPVRDLDDAAAEELYLLFPAPAGTAVEEHQIRVLEELSQAVGRTLPGLRLTNERGSSTHGFNLSDGRSQLRVKANHIAWFDGRRAVQVRVTWVD